MVAALLDAMKETKYRVGDRGILNGVAYRIVKDCASGNLEVQTEYDEIMSIKTLLEAYALSRQFGPSDAS